jgi:hypothetical protein
MSSHSSLSAKRAKLAELQAEAQKLAAEIEARNGTGPGVSATRWRQELTYHATAGLFLGMVAALVSLMFNVIGASVVGENPLQLIKVYLTFGLGEQALSPEVDSGLALATGCMLYIATGMLLGGLFHVLLTRCAADGGVLQRLAWATLIAVGIWVVNFYVLLSWIQPLLFGGNWITSMNPVYLPWWVAIATHVVFGWTMALAYPWGVVHRPRTVVYG